MIGLVTLPRSIGGGVFPPFAALASSIFRAFSLSLLSRVDMIPSLGGLPGPRFLGGGGKPSGVTKGSGTLGETVLFVVKVILVLVLPVREGEMLLSCSFEVGEVLRWGTGL